MVRVPPGVLVSSTKGVNGAGTPLESLLGAFDRTRRCEIIVPLGEATILELALEPDLEADVGVRGVDSGLGRMSVGVGGVTKVLGVPKGGGVAGIFVLIGFGGENSFAAAELCSVGSCVPGISSTVDPLREATPPLLPTPASRLPNPPAPPRLAVSSFSLGVIEFLLDGVKASLSFSTGEVLRL